MGMPRSAKFGLAVSLLLVLFFIGWTLQVVRGGSLVAFDRELALTFAETAKSDQLRRDVMVLFTILGSIPIIGLLAFVGSAWQWRRGDALLGAAWIAIVLAGGLFEIGLKVGLGRLRPPMEWRDSVAAETTPSFPSGHSMGSMIGYGMLGYVALGSSRRRRTKFAVLLALAISIGLIGFSRIYLRAHWFSDVIGGFALGAAWLAFSLACLAWLRQRGQPTLAPTGETVESLGENGSAAPAPLDPQLDPVTSTP
jgi:undecaprenyl-diphosphatase